MRSLRVPLFLVAVAMAAVVVAVELGSLALPAQAQRPATAAVAAMCAAAAPPPACSSPAGAANLTAGAQQVHLTQPPRPGLAIPDLVIADGVLLLVLGTMAAALLVPARILGRVQGIVGLVVSVLLALAGVGLVFLALGKLVLMVSLLLSIPFGTIVYLIIWGSFDRGGAAIALGLLMLLKTIVAAALGAAHQSFLLDKGLLVLVGASIVANLVVAFLHGLVPGFLVSITDAIAAIVVAIIGIVVAVLSAVGSLMSIVMAVRPPSAARPHGSVANVRVGS